MAAATKAPQLDKTNGHCQIVPFLSPFPSAGKCEANERRKGFAGWIATSSLDTDWGLGTFDTELTKWVYGVTMIVVSAEE